MNICKYCIHSKRNRENNVYECQHPDIDTRVQHHVTGERDGDAPTCEDVRKNEEQCGMRGRLYWEDSM